MAASLWLRAAASGLRCWGHRQRPAAASFAADFGIFCGRILYLWQSLPGTPSSPLQRCESRRPFGELEMEKSSRVKGGVFGTGAERTLK
ncbi:hypothetical protein H920_07052 [Fukomys damarensis]|uniref:Uncharacterized protein n=1 Tax=Fukomys damarensis TaxID=885580 RepID=A0A091DM28_FUKDA|nr:hypothetical protein H920_07052 [Fukomys damarensis]